jgi:hypothetical protein
MTEKLDQDANDSSNHDCVEGELPTTRMKSLLNIQAVSCPKNEVINLVDDASDEDSTARANSRQLINSSISSASSPILNEPPRLLHVNHENRAFNQQFSNSATRLSCSKDIDDINSETALNLNLEIDLDSILDNLPSDVESAMMLLRTQFPSTAAIPMLEIPPIILHHQLYTVLANPTEIDRGVLQLRNQGKIKAFQMYSGPVVLKSNGLSGQQCHQNSVMYGLVFSVDYISNIERTISRLIAHGRANVQSTSKGVQTDDNSQNMHLEDSKILRIFVDKVALAYSSYHVTKQQLMNAYCNQNSVIDTSNHMSNLRETDYSGHQSHKKRKIGSQPYTSIESLSSSSSLASFSSSSIDSTHNISDDCLTSASSRYISTVLNALFRHGLLTNGPDVEAYLFSVPRGGTLVQDVNRARLQIQRTLQRCRDKELSLKLLERKGGNWKDVKKGGRGMAFHIRDMAGAGLLQLVKVQEGIMVRTVNS